MKHSWRGLAVPAATAAAVYLATIAWQGFAIDPSAYLLPQLLIGLVVAGVGVAGRWNGLPAVAVVPAQVLLGGAITLWLVAGSPLPLPDTLDRLSEEFAAASHTVMHAQVPVPVAGEGVGPYLLGGAFCCFLLADVIAASLRQPPLVGLVLLGIVAVPLSVPGGRLVWWAFVLAAVGYLMLLAAAERDRIALWGRRLEGDTGVPGDGSPYVRLGATVIGAGATVAALTLPALVPTADVDLLGFGQGGSGDGPIRVTNPAVGMYDDLKEQAGTPLVSVRPVDPSAPRPEYLRIATLNVFNGREWTPGPRQIPSANTASSSFEPPFDDRDLLGDQFAYKLRASGDFQSSWLPTFVHTLRISAQGDWRYDDATLDFISTEDDLTTAGMEWLVTAAPVNPPKNRLLEATTQGTGLLAVYEELPDGFPEEIRTIAQTRTQAYTEPYRKAVALQEWLRSDDFTYSLDRDSGSGSGELLHFLTEDRRGYCQQFATAMAAMARSLGIPARVSVGFLNSERLPDQSYLFRAKDMHAWTELWFDGVGWVRFDPTPSGAGTSAPGYTRGVLGTEEEGDGGTGGSTTTPNAPGATAGPQVAPQLPQPQLPETVGTAGGAAEEDHTGTVVAAVLGLLGLLAAIALVIPSALRRRRRAARRHGGPEAGWAEIRDTARDLGLGWSDGVSPRVAGRALTAYVATAEGKAALDRMVRAVERDRYARTRSEVDVHDDVGLVRAGLLAGADRGSVRRAGLWPRSVVNRGGAGLEHTPFAELVDKELVDHTG